ncbi:two-component system, chemotaxis family, sensor kinase CheA [Gammaproteobacteria bacterium]
MTPLLAQFIAETRDQLENTGQGLLAIEQNPDDIARINEVFRAAHTIKGSSGLFEFPAITRLVHASEDLLDALRAHDVVFMPEMMDLLLDAFDHVSRWIDDIERHEQLSPESEPAARDLSNRLRAFLPGAQAVAMTAESAAIKVDLSWIGSLPESERFELFDRLQACGDPVILFDYTPDQQCFFAGDDPFFLVRQVPGLVSFRVRATEPWAPLAELDAYRCILRFSGVSSGPRSAVEERFRYVPDQVTVAAASPVVLVVPAGGPNGGPVYDDFVGDAIAHLERQDWQGLRRITSTLLEITNPDLWAASALRWFKRLLDVPQPDESALRLLLTAIPERRGPDWSTWRASGESTMTESEESAPTTPVVAVTALQRIVTPAEQAVFVEVVRQQARILALPVEPELWVGRIGSVRQVLENALRFVDRCNEFNAVDEACETVLETRATDALGALLTRLAPESATVIEVKEDVRPEEATTERDKSVTKILKVDQQKIDQLMDLIGELIVAKNSLPYLAQRAERIFGVRDLAREIKEQYAVIHRIAQGLQGSIMQVRMMPVANIFQRFPRLVRDLSRKLGKKIKLVIEGEDTEADKNVIEALADPLIHILRNSLDHGIEPPEDRVVIGKPEEGTIRVAAHQENENVVIEISDDGRGVDAAAVLRKARERGLVDEEKAATMSEEEAVQLIFAPGLSTAETLSDVSGRGVGMDVVRASVEHLGGSVKLASRFGQGTTIQLVLPLSMAVTQVMAALLDGRLIGIPIDLVLETVRLPITRIFIIKDRETFVLRERIVPLVRLRKLLELEDSEGDEEELAVLVVRVRGEPVGLIVDQFREGVEILLKPLEGVLASLSGYSGTALLGDGSVMLVLNLKELL